MTLCVVNNKKTKTIILYDLSAKRANIFPMHDIDMVKEKINIDLFRNRYLTSIINIKTRSCLIFMILYILLYMTLSHKNNKRTIVKYVNMYVCICRDLK